MIVAGYPIVFNVDSVNLGGFIEQISPAAVDYTVRGGSDLVALWNHDSNHPLGRTSAGTLALKKDARGLAVAISIDDEITFARDLGRVIGRKDAVGGSFAFRTVDDIWTIKDGVPFREVLDMVVSEISVGVTFPAYPSTSLSIATRSLVRAR